jgi:hypothetical protein
LTLNSDNQLRGTGEPLVFCLLYRPITFAIKGCLFSDKKKWFYSGFPHIWENGKNQGILFYMFQPGNALENHENDKNWEKPLKFIYHK